LAGCDFLDPDDTPPEDRAVCAALDVGTAQEFLDSDNTAVFEQLDNEEPTILFTSPRVSEPLDGRDVIELVSARVEFDFENESVDPFDAGGFWGRWIIVIVPFDMAVLLEFQNANTAQELQDLLNVLRNDITRTEVQLSGPFLRTGCEWGDTDQIGTQTIRYSNYGIYDWDFFPAVDRVLGIVFESDDGVNDDFIAWLDISRSGGGVVVEEPGRYRIDLNALANISLTP
jgi:hypothetical protein